MKDEHSHGGLKEEWSLLVHSFLEGHHPDSKAPLSLDQMKSLKKDLSLRRKKMNQAIEKIKIKIDQVSVVIDNLNLVGSDTAGLLKEIEFLNHEGEKISEEIQSLDSKIKKIHELQDNLAAS